MKFKVGDLVAWPGMADPRYLGLILRIMIGSTIIEADRAYYAEIYWLCLTRDGKHLAERTRWPLGGLRPYGSQDESAS